MTAKSSSLSSSPQPKRKVRFKKDQPPKKHQKQSLQLVVQHDISDEERLQAEDSDAALKQDQEQSAMNDHDLLQKILEVTILINDRMTKIEMRLEAIFEQPSKIHAEITLLEDTLSQGFSKLQVKCSEQLMKEMDHAMSALKKKVLQEMNRLARDKVARALDRCTHDMENLVTDNGRLQEEKAALALDRDRCVQEIERLMTNIRASTERVEKERVLAEREHDATKWERDTIKGERDFLLKERAGLREECYTFRHERDMQKTELEALRRKIAKLEQASSNPSTAGKRGRTVYEAESSGSGHTTNTDGQEETQRKRRRAAVPGQIADRDSSPDTRSAAAMTLHVKEQSVEVDELDLTVEAVDVKVEDTDPNEVHDEAG